VIITNIADFLSYADSVRGRTRRVVQTIPPDQIEWTHREGAFTLGGLVRHIAVEGERRSIRANIVAPGLMDTALGRMASQGRPGRARTPVPLGRQGTGWETAYAVLFLLSDESAYVTGQTLVVDGGLSALR